MIAIVLLFVRMLCDFFKPRSRLESTQLAHAAPSIAFVPCSSGSIVATLAFWMPHPSVGATPIPISSRAWFAAFNR
jgi:hypothetical protein